MPTTVITYRAPASYRRCGANMYDTRGARYVSVRGNGYHSQARSIGIRGSGARYVAVRKNDDFSLGRKRYGAVYDVDYGVAAPRYVAVNRNPVYVANGTRYVAVRAHTPRTKYVAVRNVDFDDDDEARYVAVRRVVPRTRYVAVRDVDIDDYYEPRYVTVRRQVPVRYVAMNRDSGYYDRGRTRFVNINSGCTRAAALRSCLDHVETTSARHIVLRNDDGYSARTKHVVLREEIDDDDDGYIVQKEIDDDDEYIAIANESPKYIEYRDAAYSNVNSATYIAANDFDNTCFRNVAVRTCRPDALNSRTITYEVSDDDDWGDRAYLRKDDAAYVAIDDTEDAWMPDRVVGTSPAIVMTRSVGYVPAEHIDEDASLLGSESAHVEIDANFPRPKYVALDEDHVFDDPDPAWVAQFGDTCLRPGVTCNFDDDDDVAATMASYVPVSDVEEMDTPTVSYVPVDDEIDVETVSYVPVRHMNVRTVSYAPVHDMNVRTVSYIPEAEVATTYVSADDGPIFVSSMYAEPVYVRDASTVFVEEVDNDLVANLRSTQRIAGRFGYRDGFEDGRDAALEGDVYHPENSGDFKKATEGYEDDYGDKDVYKDGYRESYLDGYRAGFESAG